MLETGIKVIDLLEPYVQGGKIGMFGGAGVGQDRDHPGDDPPPGRAARRCVGVRRGGGADPRGQRPVPRDDRVRRDRQDRARCSARWTSRRACGCASRCRRSRWPSTSATSSTRTCCCSWTTSSGSPRPARRSRRCSAGCRPRSATSPTWRARWATSRSGSRRARWTFHHVAPGDLRARRRHHRSGAARGVRAPGRDHGALPRDLGPRDLSGRGPAGLDEPHPRPAVRRRGSLPGRAARAGDPAALQGPAGHHRDPRDRRAVRGGQGHRRRAPARSRSSCRSRSSWPSSSPGSPGSTRRSTRRSRRSGVCARASTTICPSRRSSWSAGSRRPSSRRKQLEAVGS